MYHDSAANVLTTQSAAAGPAFDRATEAFLRHGGDAPDHLAAALSADDDLVLGHATKGLWTLLLGRRALYPTARQAWQTASSALLARGGTAREHAYLTALEYALADRFLDAASVLEAQLKATPHDALAMKISQMLRFMAGDTAGMGRATQALMPRWGSDVPHYGYLLGCHAFAQEEAGATAEAERHGHEAVAHEPEDAWGFHAVAHVLEVTGRPREGVGWLLRHRPGLKRTNNFAFHVHWHQALFHLTLGEYGEVLDLYDTRIRAEQTDDFRDIANAASLLWRLRALDVDVGDRWQELADLAESHRGDHALCFADGHYMLALVGAGRQQAAEDFVASADSGHTPHGHQDWVWRSVGRKLADAILAFGRGDDAAVVEAMVGVRGQLHRIGGSNAQRDVFELLMVEAAVRAGNRRLAAALLDGRRRRRGCDAFAKAWSVPAINEPTEPYMAAGI
jgi:tetratricopeptide (TPR) repeat protein